MKQIAFLLVLQEYLDDWIEQILLDHIENAVGVFGQDDCFEELDYLNISLDRLEPLTIRHFLHDFISNEECSDLVGVNIVLNQFVEELEDQDSTVVKLFLERTLHCFSYWCLALLFCLLHLLVLLVAFVWLIIFIFFYFISFFVFLWLFLVIWIFKIIFCDELEELSNNLI